MVPVPSFLFGASLLIAVAEQVPTLDIASGCQEAAKSLGGLGQTAEVCIRSENNTRQELVKVWTQFPAADRTSCINLTRMGSKGTYTDLITCLEIKRDARKLPKEPGLPIGPASR
jgi:hypothetical protein